MLSLLPNESPVALPATETLRPLGNYVLIQLEEQPNTTKGGLIKPQSVIESEKNDVKINPMARVLGVGPGMPIDGGKRYPMDLSVGDRVQLLRLLAPSMLEGPNGKRPEGVWFVDIGQILGVVETISE